MHHTILIADDDADVLSALAMLLKSEGYQTVTATTPDQAVAALRQQDFDLILMDLNYSRDTTSGDEGLQLIAALRKLDELVPIVVMTGWGTIEVAVSTMQKGANDFIQKPWENDRLLAIIKNQTALARSRRQSQKLSRENQLLREAAAFGEEIIADSPAIRRVLATLKQVAQSDVNILLTGENGTGKSLFARYIHDLSPRRQAAQISVNMGAVPETLFESEMFGHVKGAFTDAKATRIGRFELADGGTLFLDEIANTPLSQQGKLLRVLEDSQFEKVGASKTQKVDVRLITATNADLDMAVREGRFRQDLLYRLNTIVIEIPPLRARTEDILPLARSFLAHLARKYGRRLLSIDASAAAALKAYGWPGNVRELSHVMERSQILCRNNRILPQDLGLGGQAVKGVTAVDGEALRPLSDIEAGEITRRLDHFAGDAEKTARSLGLSRSAFYRKLQKIKA
ncbi:sigma-54-dependent transcriptional regulator [Paremcibacter congregatus]|uniref:sigma-54-dependent transcriptional regulator n=1 Tax=Paremcibacter congregatus TaxID=2043170 RepID=UPI003A8FE831